MNTQQSGDGSPGSLETVEAYLALVQKRRSIRKLTAGPVTEQIIHTIVEAGRWSPSSANTQPVRMVVVRERHHELWSFIEQTLQETLQGAQLERALQRLPGYRSGVFTIVFYEDTTIADNPPPGASPDHWKNFAVQAMGISQANVWNAITAAGLAASNQHINLQIEEALRTFLGVPTIWKSYSMFPVGYPAEVLQEGTRHPHEHIIFYEHGPTTI